MIKLTQTQPPFEKPGKGTIIVVKNDASFRTFRSRKFLERSGNSNDDVVWIDGKAWLVTGAEYVGNVESTPEIGLVVRPAKPEEINKDLKHRFAYHAPSGGKAQKHERVRKLLLDVAIELEDLVPPGRELSHVHSKLEEAMMWANAGIARNPELP